MKKGISLVEIVITVVLLTILAGVIIFSSTDTIEGVDKSKLKMDIAQIEALMNTYNIRKNGNIQFETVKFVTSNLSAEELNQFDGETITANSITLYVVDLAEIDVDEVSYGNLKLGQDDRYLYSQTTGKVYYEKGLEIDNIRYYYVTNGDR